MEGCGNVSSGLHVALEGEGGRKGGREEERKGRSQGGGEVEGRMMTVGGKRKEEVNVIARLFVFCNYEEQCCVTFSCRLNVCCTQASKR